MIKPLLRIQEGSSLVFAVAAFLVCCQLSTAQTPDSVVQIPKRGSLQFQLVGGIGINYFAPIGSSSCIRLGVDVAFKHEHSDGSYDEQAVVFPSSVTISKGYPASEATSYDLTVSGLFIQTLSEFMSTSFYCGIGPSVSFSYSKAVSNVDDRAMLGASFNSVKGTSEDKSTVRGLGGLALLGARARLVENVSISAELCFSALHKWSNTSTYSETMYAFSEGNAYQISDSKSSSGRGWSTTVSRIRVGLVIGI
jgi:hypothetical protein